MTDQTQEREGRIKSHIEAPKWARVPSMIKKLCFELDMKLEMDIDKGFFRETVYFKVYGTESKLLKFKEILEKSIEEYNRE